MQSVRTLILTLDRPDDCLQQRTFALLFFAATGGPHQLCGQEGSLILTSWCLESVLLVHSSLHFPFVCAFGDRLCAATTTNRCVGVSARVFHFPFSLTSQARWMAAHTPEAIHPETLLQSFRPLPNGQYPLFATIPETVVNYEVRFSC